MAESTPETAEPEAAPVEEIRQDMVDTAIKFLTNPKVVSSPISRKTAFLENKGLNAGEIQKAMEAVAAGGAGLHVRESIWPVPVSALQCCAVLSLAKSLAGRYEAPYCDPWCAIPFCSRVHISHRSVFISRWRSREFSGRCRTAKRCRRTISTVNVEGLLYRNGCRC